MRARATRALALAGLIVLAGAAAIDRPTASPGALRSSTDPVAIPPAPTRWVEDHAEFLTPATRSALDARLESYENATRHQVVVWIGQTLAGAALDEWAVRTFEAWKVGRTGFDDGIAMFVFADDRTIDIEVGYGLEDKVPDAVASRIIRDVMAPRLRAGDRDGAVTSGVEAVLAAIERRPWTDPTSTAPAPSSTPTTPSVPTLIFGAIALVAFAIFAITNPRAAMFLLWTLATSARRNGSRRGFGGGSGFGGGGGRSGGGGARGGW